MLGDCSNIKPQLKVNEAEIVANTHKQVWIFVAIFKFLTDLSIQSYSNLSFRTAVMSKSVCPFLISDFKISQR